MNTRDHRGKNLGIDLDIGSDLLLSKVPMPTIRRAALYVADHARSKDDAVLLLDMLGLTERLRAAG